MNRLHAVVEGHGDVAAIPTLMARIIAHPRRSSEWIVNAPASRLPRGQIVDESGSSPRRPPLIGGVDRAVELAVAAKAKALIIVVDADDDCPASFGPAAARKIEERLRGAAVMAVREFETWILFGFSDTVLRGAEITAPENVRDAKRALGRIVPRYAPTTHQLQLARQIDIDSVRRRSASFDKLVREVDRLTE